MPQTTYLLGIHVGVGSGFCTIPSFRFVRFVSYPTSSTRHRAHKLHRLTNNPCGLQHAHYPFRTRFLQLLLVVPARNEALVGSAGAGAEPGLASGFGLFSGLSMLQHDSLWEWWHNQPEQATKVRPPHAPTRAEDVGREEVFGSLNSRPHPNPDVVNAPHHHHTRTDLLPHNDGSVLAMNDTSPAQHRYANLYAASRQNGTEAPAVFGTRDAEHAPSPKHTATPSKRPHGRNRCANLLPTFDGSPSSMASALQESKHRTDPQGNTFSAGSSLVVARGSPLPLDGRRQYLKGDADDLQIGLRPMPPPRGLPDHDEEGTSHGMRQTDVTEALRPSEFYPPDADYAPPTIDYNRSSWRLGEARPQESIPQHSGRMNWDRRAFDTTGRDHLYFTQTLDGSTPPPPAQAPPPPLPPQIIPLRGKLSDPAIHYGRWDQLTINLLYEPMFLYAPPAFVHRLRLCLLAAHPSHGNWMLATCRNMPQHAAACRNMPQHATCIRQRPLPASH